MKEIVDFYRRGFDRASKKRAEYGGRRIGSELKFPFIKSNGRAADADDAGLLWKHLCASGWSPVMDPHTGKTTGCELPGGFNNSIARPETGHCIIEFSMAHAGNLHELRNMYIMLGETLDEFSERHRLYFLACGMHPVEPPGRHLVAKKSRNLFWDTMFGSNRIVPPERGTDVHLFALSAAHQVHVDVSIDESIRAVNVLNGFAGAQTALTANSQVWQNTVAEHAQCLGELFWDWWLGDQRDRAGVPERYFTSIEDYAACIGGYSPVFVRRNGDAIGLPGYDTFRDYYTGGVKQGRRGDGSIAEVLPAEEDISLHNTFFWHGARISRYFTIENRMNDQQPYDEMAAVPALTLGLVENLDEANEIVRGFRWGDLRSLRNAAVHWGLDASVDGISAAELCGTMVEAAERGLVRRGLGEERYLEPLYRRLESKTNPAVCGSAVYRERGLKAYLDYVKVKQE
jgi:gamma-glutamylcysteine synthetase